MASICTWSPALVQYLLIIRPSLTLLADDAFAVVICTTAALSEYGVQHRHRHLVHARNLDPLIFVLIVASQPQLPRQ